MTGLWRCGLILWLATALSGCGTYSSGNSLLAAPVEAARPPADPNVAATVLMAVWDDSLGALEVEAIDLATGSPAPGWSRLVLPDGGRDIAGYTLSASGDRMAVLSGTAPFCSRSAGGSACWSGANRLHVIDLAARDDWAFDLGLTAYIPTLTFSPDGRTVALARNNRDGFGVSLWRNGAGGSSRDVSLTFLPSLLEYSSDGRELIALGAHPGEDPGMTEPGPLTVAALDAETLAILWEETLDVRHGGWCLEGCGDSHEQILFASWTPAIVRLPGTDRIVILHADSERMTTIDAALRRIQTIDIVTARSWLDRLMALGTTPAEAKGGSQGVFRQAVASPDGTRVYAVGREYQAWKNAEGMWEMSEPSLGLQVIDPRTGRRLTTLETDAYRVALSEDGAWMLLHGWLGPTPWTEMFSTGTLRAGRTLEGWDIQTGQTLEGASVILATSDSTGVTRVAQVDPDTLDIGEPWSLPGHATLLLP